MEIGHSFFPKGARMIGVHSPVFKKFLEQRNEEEGGIGAPEFLSTHSAHTTRIENLKTYLPEALPHYQKFKKEIRR